VRSGRQDSPPAWQLVPPSGQCPPRMRRTNSLGPMRWCRISVAATSPPQAVRESWWSHPLLRLEHDVECDPETEHEPQRHRITEGPMEFGHIVEVHPVDRTDQGRREEDRGPAGDLLHVLVLALGDEGGIDVEDLRQCFPQLTGLGEDPGEMVGDIVEV